MNRHFLFNEHPSKQLLFTGLVVIGCWIAFQVISFSTGIFIFRIPVNQLVTDLKDYSNPRIVSFLKYVQAITSFGMFIFASFIIARQIESNWKKFLTLDKKAGLIPVTIAGVLIIILLPFTNLLTYLNNEIQFPELLSGLERFFHSKEDQMEQIMEAFLNVDGFSALIINLLVIAVIPAIGEELIFRGIVQNRFTIWFKNHHLAILLTSFIFSALHIQFLSFLPRFFLGVVLGYMFYWSKSIWLIIISHFINNALAVIFYQLYYAGKVDKTIELIGTPHYGLVYSILAVLGGSVLIYVLMRYFEKKKPVPD
jgi:uncharacterized protein